jgi:hypothetical protein
MGRSDVTFTATREPAIRINPSTLNSFCIFLALGSDLVVRFFCQRVYFGSDREPPNCQNHLNDPRAWDTISKFDGDGRGEVRLIAVLLRVA